MEIIREIELFGGPFDGLKRQIPDASGTREQPSAIGVVFDTGSGEKKKVWYALRDDGRYVYVQSDQKQANSL
jgi:hypothetical protein